jgi:hypothetical protein
MRHQSERLMTGRTLSAAKRRQAIVLRRPVHTTILVVANVLSNIYPYDLTAFVTLVPGPLLVLEDNCQHNTHIAWKA